MKDVHVTPSQMTQHHPLSVLRQFLYAPTRVNFHSVSF